MSLIDRLTIPFLAQAGVKLPSPRYKIAYWHPSIARQLHVVDWNDVLQILPKSPELANLMLRISANGGQAHGDTLHTFEVESASKPRVTGRRWGPRWGLRWFVKTGATSCLFIKQKFYMDDLYCARSSTLELDRLKETLEWAHPFSELHLSNNELPCTFFRIFDQCGYLVNTGEPGEEDSLLIYKMKPCSLT